MADYSDYIPEEIKETRSEAGKLGQRASKIGAQAYTFPQRLREAIKKKYDYNKDLIQEQSRAQAEYFAAPAVAREKYVKQPGEEGYITPMQAEKLVAQEKAQAYAPYASLTDILGQRMGSIANIVKEGTGAFQAQVAAAQGAAQQAQQALANLIQEYQLGQQMQQQAWQQEQTEEATDFEREQWEWKKPWKEKLWEYQLNQPYYKPTTPEEDETVDTAELDTAISTLYQDYLNSLQQEELSTGQSSWTPPESGYSGYTSPYNQ